MSKNKFPVPPDKYRWDISIKWVIEFCRFDAEVMVDLDGKRFQKKIGHFENREQATIAATDYAANLFAKICDLVEKETSTLADAQE